MFFILFIKIDPIIKIKPNIAIEYDLGKFIIDADKPPKKRINPTKKQIIFKIDNIIIAKFKRVYKDKMLSLFA